MPSLPCSVRFLGLMLATATLGPSMFDSLTAASAVRGTVTSVERSEPLAGATVSLARLSSDRVVETITTAKGEFTFAPVGPGNYALRVWRSGFEEWNQAVHVGLEESPVDLTIALSVADPDGQAGGASTEAQGAGSSGQTVEARLADVAPLKGDDFATLFPPIPGVLRDAEGRMQLKGAQPKLRGLEVGAIDVTDVFTAHFGYQPPIRAFESITTRPDPYLPEFDRFVSSEAPADLGEGANHWRFGLSDVIPGLKWRTGTIMGIGSVNPRVTVSGPIARDRVFMALSLRYRKKVIRIPALPDLHNDAKLEGFEGASRVDAQLSPSHALTATASVFPRRLTYVNLNKFNPQEVTPNFHQRGYAFTLSESAALSPAAMITSGVGFRRYDADIFGQGFGAMSVKPSGNEGYFFNRQDRRTNILQWTEGLSLLRKGGGKHLVKLGLDLLHSRLDGDSLSRSVLIERADGSPSATIDYSGASSQRLRSTDVGLFVEDGWRVGNRLLLEPGLRLDRDGVFKRRNLAPRLGFAIGLLPEGKSMLRGGAGFFCDRTPLNAGAFTSFERQVVTPFVGPLAGELISYDYRLAGPLRTPRELVWNLEYDQRLSRQVFLKMTHLRRNGQRQLILDTSQPTSNRSALVLDSRGRSRYWESELSLRYYRDEEHELTWSYIRSQYRADLNVLDHYFGNFRNPIIRPNEFSDADLDVPHRLMWRGNMAVWKGLTLGPVVEIRSGFPYSLVNQDQDFVGPRNRGGRFPRQTICDLSVTRTLKIRKWKPRVGIRVYNLLNSFSPRDVQNNIDAVDFRTFYNTIPRSYQVVVHFER
jgi:hypothetical protein